MATEKNSGMSKAIKAIGSQKGLAEVIGVGQSTIHLYLYSGPTAKRALSIHEKTGVPLAELRKDLWGEKGEEA